MKDRHLIARGTPGWLIFNEVNDTSATYEQGVNWEEEIKPRFLNLENWSGENIDLVVTNDADEDISIPVPAGLSLQGLEIKDYIKKVVVTALGKYNLIIRK